MTLFLFHLWITLDSLLLSKVKTSLISAFQASCGRYASSEENGSVWNKRGFLLFCTMDGRIRWSAVSLHYGLCQSKSEEIWTGSWGTGTHTHIHTFIRTLHRRKEALGVHLYLLFFFLEEARQEKISGNYSSIRLAWPFSYMYTECKSVTL